MTLYTYTGPKHQHYTPGNHYDITISRGWLTRRIRVYRTRGYDNELPETRLTYKNFEDFKKEWKKKGEGSPATAHE